MLPYRFAAWRQTDIGSPLQQRGCFRSCGRM